MMPPTFLAKLTRRYARDEKAVAAVEFALIMPFLLALYFGSMEGAALYTADKKVNSISATVGDLVAQWDPGDGTLATSTLNDYASASTGLINPYSVTGVKTVVTLIEVKSDGSTKVLWSKAYGGGTALTVGNAFTPLITSSMMDQVSRGGCLIASQTSYSYKPLLAQVFTSALNLSHINYFLPRYGSTQPINLDTTSLAGTACTA